MKKIFNRTHDEVINKQKQSGASASEEVIATQTISVEEVHENPTDAIPEPTPVSTSPTQESAGTDENLEVTLKQLTEQVSSLSNEKSQIISMEESMHTKIVAEIEAKKQSIETLKQEIPRLKQKCEYLANILKIPVYK